MILLCIYSPFIILAGAEYIVPLKAILVAITTILTIFKQVLAVISTWLSSFE